MPYGYEFLGDQTVKNISKPVGAYRVVMEPRVTVVGKPIDKKPATIRRRLLLVGAVVVLALAVAVGIWWFTVRHPKEEPASARKMAVPLPERPAIAVLPFENMSGDPEHSYFSDGITEEIITKLSMSPGIDVIARNSSFFYKGKQINIQQIAQELRARYVVEGSVRKAGNRVRITAQLIDATTARHLWAKTYDHEYKDIFILQDGIAQHIPQGKGHVIAFHAKGRWTDGAPPSGYSSVDMRGYTRGQYLASHMTMGEADYRYSLTDKWGLAAFAGVAALYGDDVQACPHRMRSR